MRSVRNRSGPFFLMPFPFFDTVSSLHHRRWRFSLVSQRKTRVPPSGYPDAERGYPGVPKEPSAALSLVSGTGWVPDQAHEVCQGTLGVERPSGAQPRAACGAVAQLQVWCRWSSLPAIAHAGARLLLTGTGERQRAPVGHAARDELRALQMELSWALFACVAQAASGTSSAACGWCCFAAAPSSRRAATSRWRLVAQRRACSSRVEARPPTSRSGCCHAAVPRPRNPGRVWSVRTHRFRASRRRQTCPGFWCAQRAVPWLCFASASLACRSSAITSQHSCFVTRAGGALPTAAACPLRHAVSQRRSVAGQSTGATGRQAGRRPRSGTGCRTSGTACPIGAAVRPARAPVLSLLLLRDQLHPSAPKNVPSRTGGARSLIIFPSWIPSQ